MMPNTAASRVASTSEKMVTVARISKSHHQQADDTHQTTGM
jgi:hypothetical protein